jgi:hypothetical protein
MKEFWGRPEVIDDLTRLWALPVSVKSSKQIAEEMSERWGHKVTPNSAIGAADRLGLPFRVRGPRTPCQQPVEKQERKPKRERKASPPKQPRVEARVPVLGRLNACCYPFETAKGWPRWRFCGEPTEHHKPYCRVHYEMTHVVRAKAA